MNDNNVKKLHMMKDKVGNAIFQLKEKLRSLGATKSPRPGGLVTAKNSTKRVDPRAKRAGRKLMMSEPQTVDTPALGHGNSSWKAKKGKNNVGARGPAKGSTNIGTGQLVRRINSPKLIRKGSGVKPKQRGSSIVKAYGSGSGS